MNINIKDVGALMATTCGVFSPDLIREVTEVSRRMMENKCKYTLIPTTEPGLPYPIVVRIESDGKHEVQPGGKGMWFNAESRKNNNQVIGVIRFFCFLIPTSISAIQGSKSEIASDYTQLTLRVSGWKN